MKYEEILSLLPSELLVEGNANNIKKVLSIYSTITGVGDELNEDYGAILDIYGATGQQLDFIGAMFAVFRYDLEADETYRTRILADIIKKRTPTTLPDIQGAVDSIVNSGKLYVMENYRVTNSKDVPNTKIKGAIGVEDGDFGYWDTNSTDEENGFSSRDYIYGIPCNIYLTGTADEQSITTTIEVLKNILPAGVFILVPVASFDTWQNIYNQFSLWQSLLDEGYIW